MLSTRLIAAALPSPLTLAVYANSRTPPDPERFLTDHQLATRWGCVASSIWRAAKRDKDKGHPQPVRLMGRVTRFRLSDIEAWERRRV